MRVRGRAGSGKTAVLRERFHDLVADHDPERVVLVVRARRDRDEARRAITARLQRSLPSLRVLTIQGLARDVLMRGFSSLGYREPPRILSAPDQFARVRELLAGEDPARWPAYGALLGMDGFADEVRQFLLRAQEARLEPERIAQHAAAADLGGWHELTGFYRRYLDVLEDLHEVDFAGLVWKAALAAERRDPAFDHVMMDDAQDTTEGAAELLFALRADSTVVAGDEHAHVFSFQGSSLAPFLGLPQRIPGMADVELTERHRTSAARMDAWVSAHPAEEHAAIARELRRIHASGGVRWRDLAVIGRRQGPNLASVVRALDDARVPRYVPEGGVAFSSEPATLPYVLALTWIAHPQRRDDLIVSVLTSRLGGLSSASARGLLRAARRSGAPPADALRHREGLAADEAATLDRTVAALDTATACSTNVGDAFTAIWRGLDHSSRLVAEDATGDIGVRGPLEAVLALSEAVGVAAESEDPSVEAFVAALEASGDAHELATIRDSDADAVQVLTAHAAAGREFDTVVIVGAVEGDFPSLTRPEPMFDLAVLERRRSQAERTAERLADERRLFEMVVARARSRVILAASDPVDDPELSVRTRFAPDASWEHAPAPSADDPVSTGDAAAAWRRTLADPLAAASERMLALEGLVAIGDEPSTWWYQRTWSDDLVPRPGPPTLSFSRLRPLPECELRYVLGSELGLARGVGFEATLGTMMHRLFEDMDRDRIPRTWDALAAEFERRWDPATFPSRAVADMEHDVAKARMLQHWWENYGRQPALAAEMTFAFDLDGVRISGRIDRIDEVEGGSRIVDYKTSRTPGGRTDGTPSETDLLQLQTYLVAVDRDPALERFRPVRRLEVAYVRGERTGKPRIARRFVDLTDDAAAARHREEATQRLTGLVAQVRELARTGAYTPQPGDHCDRCDFRLLCPAFGGTPAVPATGVTA